MRNLQNAIRTEFGMENIAILRKWEHLEMKIANSRTIEDLPLGV